MILTRAEENYIKAIFKIADQGSTSASTNHISREISTSASSVTDMIKRLSEKGLVAYEKYRGVTLTSEGRQLATALVRRHRLWECFLVNKLKFRWDEVHHLAEELEHIASEELANRLDDFLDNPKYDPHGDPIPNAHGKWTVRRQVQMAEMTVGSQATIVGVRDQSNTFLKHLDEQGIAIDSVISIIERYPYDNSLLIQADGRKLTVSQQVAGNLFVKPVVNHG